MARGSPGSSNTQQSPWLWTELVCRFHCALGDTSQPPREAAIGRGPAARAKLIVGLKGSQWSYTTLIGHPNTKMSIMGTGSFPTACQQHGQGRAATGMHRFEAAQPLASPKGSRGTCVGMRKCALGQALQLHASPLHQPQRLPAPSWRHMVASVFQTFLSSPAPAPGSPAHPHSLELPWDNSSCRRFSKPPCPDGAMSTGTACPTLLGTLGSEPGGFNAARTGDSSARALSTQRPSRVAWAWTFFLIKYQALKSDSPEWARAASYR